MNNIRIVIGGPPNSGKSVFTLYLQRAMRQLQVRAYHNDYDPYSETRLMLMGDISKELREQLKKTDVGKSEAEEFAKKFKQKHEDYPLVLGDLPGKVSDITKILAKSGTHAIIVCDEKKHELIKEWKLMFEELGINIICIINTNLDGIEEITNSNSIIFAKVANLDRNNIAVVVPAHLLALAQEIKTKLSL